MLTQILGLTRETRTQVQLNEPALGLDPKSTQLRVGSLADFHFRIYGSLTKHA